ncbi:MAG: phosphoenolpyruvate synthase [Sporocytophaga sp.]|uniref:phosphoenolpyruvate synthase n=1 Tax=Sporocytophaga sp. TaxID=2231183 RepID=UPI001B0F9A41|nr:phosphoenolpyruvate synthase [Sporocytophaga sp.]MBO9703065.1 phosphoenolpyruvate synthase [Sporocytophaga sp.]
MQKYILAFNEIHLNDIAQVGGKNSSLGEMFNILSSKGINIPDGFATTSYAYQEFIKSNKLSNDLKNALDKLDTKTFSNLTEVGSICRNLILKSTIPLEIETAIKNGYIELCKKYGFQIHVAVRSSATAEDLPDASFAGQHESYLNICCGEENLLKACLNCLASLFTDRAIKYRHDNGFDHMKVALSIGIQKMIRSDLASSGVCFTLDPDSGFEDIILITGSWGLGENVVQGAVNPDEFYVFKKSLQKNKQAILNKKIGSKEKTMIYNNDAFSDNTIKNIETPKEKRNLFILNDEEIHLLAKWSLIIEEHYQKPMDIEWAKDGEENKIYIVQARPETVYSRKRKQVKITEYRLKEKGNIITSGKAIGNQIATGTVRIINSPEDSYLLKEGEILVTDITNPDWDPILKKASAIITNKGGRTSHAAIIARELGAVAIVGTGNATSVIKDGDTVTVSCAEGETGTIYEGKLLWEVIETNLEAIEKPKTKVMFILGNPEKAFHLSRIPNDGVGLMRLEFIINNSIKVHPMALIKFDSLKDQAAKSEIENLTSNYSNKESYFIENLSRSVATIAAAFYPNDVIVRMTDFKTNEYANLVGGKEFEPLEANPMLGFRGASRYYNDAYKEGFGLECKAMKVVRDEMGLTNVKLMIPFCRTVEEGKKVIEIMNTYGLRQGENELEIYVMAEIPSNVILADEFASIFDGFSIGSNDLTQLTLGIDRDSSTVSELFDENNEAPKKMIRLMINSAKQAGRKIGLCGQAPSDFPEFAQFLVENKIDSISFNPDAMIKGIQNIKEAEVKFRHQKIEH